MAQKTPIRNPASIPYKRVLCRFYEKRGYCSSGSDCTFAHGEDDIHRPVIAKVVWTTTYKGQKIEVWALAFSVKRAREILNQRITSLLQAYEERRVEEANSLIPDLPLPQDEKDVEWLRSLLGLVLTGKPEVRNLQLVGSDLV